jgi:DNA-binding NarL/FixJ family response regulator
LLADAADLARVARLPLPHAEDPGARGQEDAGRSSLGLTEREQQVLCLVAEGRTNREIGKLLYISPKTASVHVTRIMQKLGVSSRVQAAAIAGRHGLPGSKLAGTRAP